MSRSIRRVRGEGADPGLAELSLLFDGYRRHHGQPPGGPASRAWLEAGLTAGVLHGFLACEGDLPVGMAIASPTPASLRLGTFWQLRDLYVDEPHRARGIGRDLVSAVCDAALADGALRVSLTTEAANAAALRLYSSMGFEPVHGYVALALQLPGAPRRG